MRYYCRVGNVSPALLTIRISEMPSLRSNVFLAQLIGSISAIISINGNDKEVDEQYVF